MDSGETISLEQTYKGQNAEGHMDMHSVINGNIPVIEKGSQVVIPDYKDEYRRTRPGKHSLRKGELELKKYCSVGIISNNLSGFVGKRGIQLQFLHQLEFKSHSWSFS